jgi:pimeloyl-ACP methyl ester carboxylesterase
VTQDPIPHWPGGLIDLGDHQVYVRSVPDEDHDQDHGAEPALCVHGLAGSSRNWTDLMDLLRPRLACDALDLPGFGDSPPRPDGRYTIAALAQTVAALIERNRKRPVHLIANSLGGAVCVRLAATRPDLVQTLTLISPALPDSRPRLDLVRFPVMSLPRLGPRLLRKYEALPPQARVADVITTCYADPARFPPARFNAEVTELARRDTLGYATDAMVGSIRALTA